MKGQLADRVVIVTGGSSGIGFGIAERFAAEGGRVIITGGRLAELDKAVTSVLAADAGFYEFAALGEITEEHFDKTFDTNVRGLLFTVQRALASVILTGSMMPIKGFAACSVYNASKAAIGSFARTWVVDLNRRRRPADAHFYSWMLPPGLPPRWVQAHLELFASKVIPAFR